MLNPRGKRPSIAASAGHCWRERGEGWRHADIEQWVRSRDDQSGVPVALTDGGCLDGSSDRLLTPAGVAAHQRVMSNRRFQRSPGLSSSPKTTASSSRAVPLSRSPSALERIAEIVLRRRPVERNPLARPFLQRRAIGRHRLLQPRRPALPLPERLERIAEIVLRRRPVERNPLARPFLQRRAIGRHRLLEPRRPALPLPERSRAQCRDSSASPPSRAEPARASAPPAPRDRPRPPPRAAPSRSPARRALSSASPRLVCVAAQSSGTRSRVSSSSAAR